MRLLPMLIPIPDKAALKGWLMDRVWPRRWADDGEDDMGDIPLFAMGLDGRIGTSWFRIRGVLE